MATALADPLVSWEKTEVEDPSLLMALSRADRASIAEDTLRKLQAGGYRARDGVQIRFEKDIAFTRENSVLYTEDDLHKMKKPVSTADDTKSASSTTKFEVLHCTTLQAAQALAAKVDEDSIGVLNFASAKNPGGGFLRGASAQEESLARTSSLYLALTEERFINGFYDYNRRGRSGVYSNRLIYSPRVTVFKVRQWWLGISAMPCLSIGWRWTRVTVSLSRWYRHRSCSECGCHSTSRSGERCHDGTCQTPSLCFPSEQTRISRLRSFRLWCISEWSTWGGEDLSSVSDLKWILRCFQTRHFRRVSPRYVSNIPTSVQCRWFGAERRTTCGTSSECWSSTAGTETESVLQEEETARQTTTERRRTRRLRLLRQLSRLRKAIPRLYYFFSFLMKSLPSSYGFRRICDLETECNSISHAVFFFSLSLFASSFGREWKRTIHTWRFQSCSTYLRERWDPQHPPMTLLFIGPVERATSSACANSFRSWRSNNSIGKNRTRHVLENGSESSRINCLWNDELHSGTPTIPTVFVVHWPSISREESDFFAPTDLNHCRRCTDRIDS